MKSFLEKDLEEAAASKKPCLETHDFLLFSNPTSGQKSRPMEIRDSKVTSGDNFFITPKMDNQQTQKLDPKNTFFLSASDKKNNMLNTQRIGQ